MNRRTFLFGLLGGFVSSNHHTPIATGAAANASTFNNPFGELDAAIDDVDDRIDALILSDGTSDAEVVDSRNGYTLLNDRLDDMTLRGSVLYVDALFTTNAAANRFTTIASALATCTGGETILIAPGIYTENITVADDGVRLVGSGMPRYDSGTGRLVGGTIVRGRISLGVTVGTEVRDLGVDLFGVNSMDCIGSSNTTIRYYRNYINLALLGNGTGALAHGLYGSGDYLTIHNVRVYNCHHGIAIHGSHVNISNVHFYSCYGSALIIKAKLNNTHIVDVNATNLKLIGQDSANLYSGSIYIQSEDDLDVSEVNISNVNARYCINGVVVVDHNGGSVGVVSGINFSNIVSRYNQDLSDVGDYRFWTGTNIMLTNCQSLERVQGYAFQTADDGTLGDVRIMSAIADTSGLGAISGSVVSNDFATAVINGHDVARRSAVIASGAITATARRMRVDTEAAAATDELDTINGGFDGQILILASLSNSQDVTVRHIGGGTGNIHLASGTAKVLGNRSDRLVLEYDSVTSFWEQLTYSDNL